MVTPKKNSCTCTLNSVVVFSLMWPRQITLATPWLIKETWSKMQWSRGPSSSDLLWKPGKCSSLPHQLRLSRPPRSTIAPSMGPTFGILEVTRLRMSTLLWTLPSSWPGDVPSRQGPISCSRCFAVVSAQQELIFSPGMSNSSTAWGTVPAMRWGWCPDLQPGMFNL